MIVGASVLMLANARRIEGVPLWGWLLFAGAIALLVIWLGARTRVGKVKDLESLEQLSAMVSSANREQRYILSWYEYAIVRNVERGTYNGEPPADFKLDVFDLTARMGQGTRYSFRVTWWVFGAIAVATTVMMIAMDGPWDGGFPWVLVIILAITFTLVFGLAGLFMWWMSRRPISLLGKRLEDASTLPTGPRLDALSQIARDEFALASGVVVSPAQSDQALHMSQPVGISSASPSISMQTSHDLDREPIRHGDAPDIGLGADSKPRSGSPVKTFIALAMMVIGGIGLLAVLAILAIVNKELFGSITGWLELVFMALLVLVPISVFAGLVFGGSRLFARRNGAES